MPDEEFRVGETLIISCDWADAQVTKVDGFYVCLEWPRGTVDPQSRYRWNGQCMFPRDPRHYDWSNTPWHLEPDSDQLETGDTCQVGIPPTRVLVREVYDFDPPEDLGSLPRPTRGLAVVAVNEQDNEDAGFILYLDGRDPISVTLADPVPESGRTDSPA